MSTLYLSRIRLNTQKRGTQIAMASPSKFHGAVEGCFESNKDRKLWRIDTLKGSCYMLILSPEKPDLLAIKKQFGFPEDTDEIKDYDAFLSSIDEGSVWQFRLAANPVHSIKEEGMDRGKVAAHVSEKYQMDWLRQKAAHNGFTVISDGSCVVGSGWKIFKKKNNDKRVRLKEAVYEGMLRVDDADMFRKALAGGIGRGKAYGMGLLTIMKV